MTGGNIALGALTGAISGAIFFGAGEILPGITKALGATTRLEQVVVSTGVHAVAGAVSGGINAAISGSNIGLGMLTGAVGAGIGNAAGSFLPSKFEYQLVGQVVAGAIAGGIVSALYGGNFWQGFAQGAYTAAVGFLFNQMVHETKKIYGWATFYDPTGRATASGEPYDGKSMTAAINPEFAGPQWRNGGAMATVECLSIECTGKSIQVRINDRMPPSNTWRGEVPGTVPKIIDLSPAAMETLVGPNYREIGTVAVKVTIER